MGRLFSGAHPSAVIASIVASVILQEGVHQFVVVWMVPLLRTEPVVLLKAAHPPTSGFSDLTGGTAVPFSFQ